MKKKKIFVPIIVVLLIIAIIGGGAYLYIDSKLSKMKTTEISKKPSDLGIDTKQFDQNTSKDIDKNYVNILLMGSDSRDPDTDPGLVDSIMILSIDKEHNKLKLTSLMRDMLIDNVVGEGVTEGTTLDRINVIYKQGGGKNGGGQYSIKAINSNFDMNIKNYVKVDFTHFDKIIDAVGGIDMNISSSEVEVANNYIREVAKINGVTPKLLTTGGMQHLNGIQALGYSRIRYVGRQDFQRTERQRAVLTQVFSRLASMNPAEASTALDTIFPDVETSLSKTDILSYITYVITNKITTINQFRLPEDKAGYSFSKYIKGTYFLGWDRDKNVADLHQFIFEGDLK